MHTPGPWKLHDPRPTPFDVVAEVNGDQMPIVQLTHWGTSRMGDECQANACLIAAAPDLLKACKTAMPILHWANCHGSRCDEAIAQVLTALAKAEGKEAVKEVKSVGI